MDPKLLEQLTGMQTDMAAFIAKADTERKESGAASTETKASLKAIQERMDSLEQKLIAFPGKSEVKTLAMCLKENESVQRMVKDGRGRAHISLSPEASLEVIQGKSTITSDTVGFPTAGVMPEERGRYVQEARQQLRIRDVIPSRPTVLQQISWPKASITPSKASPVAEAALKPENQYDPVMVTERVKTVATFFKAGRQVLEDWTELGGILRSAGSHQVLKEFERQFLFGDNTGENLNGLTTQAQAWDLTIMTASDGYEYIDIAAGAFQQVDADDEVESTFIIVNKGDWWKIRRTKDSTGRYILGDPQSPVEPTLWGRRVVSTNQMTAGYFLAGSGDAAASEIRDRMGLKVELSTEDGDNFRYNLVTIRFEARSCICVYRPNAFVYGAFTQSPA